MGTQKEGHTAETQCSIGEWPPLGAFRAMNEESR